MEYPCNGTIQYKDREYMLKNGIDKDSATTLLEACERSGHLSEMMFYKTWKLLARKGMSVNEALGMSNQTLVDISRANNVGTATLEVLCELQVMGKPDFDDDTAIGELKDTTDKESDMRTDSPFTPTYACELVNTERKTKETHDEKPHVIKNTKSEITVQYNNVTMRLVSENDLGKVVLELSAQE